MHFKVNYPKNSKNGIEILVGQEVFKVWFQVKFMWNVKKIEILI